MTEPHANSAEHRPNKADVERLVADVYAQTLSQLGGDFSRLIYLASLRDHNTGRYHHYGLESRYPEPVVDEGLRRCHQEVFEKLLALTLQEQTQDLLRYFESIREERARLVEVWERLQSYKILPPENCHPLARDLFEANMTVVLRILQETELWGLLRDPHGDADDLP